MIDSTLKFFDKLEDKVRGRLSHFPVVYSIIGGIAIVIFWRGVWVVCDHIAIFDGLDGGILSVLLSGAVMLATGLFVSFFIGDTIILSGLKREKKIVEKTEEELKEEADTMLHIRNHLDILEKMIAEIQNKMDKMNGQK